MSAANGFNDPSDWNPGDTWDTEPVAVESSNVGTIRRTGKDGVNLEVHFRTSRTTYEYIRAGHEFADMLAAPSKGVFVHRRLIPGYAAVKK